MCEVAEDVTGVHVPGTAHWVPKENPEAFVAALLEVVRQPATADAVR